MPELDPTGPVAAYARACLTAARTDRDWFRRAVTRLEEAGYRIVLTEQPDRAGDPWSVLDWRTGETLATITGGDDEYEAAWQPSWTDVCWVGSRLEGLAGSGRPGPDWPDDLPPPPPAAGAPAPLALPLPKSLAARLQEAIEAWALEAAVVDGRTAQVAELTGWPEDRVLACTGSWLTITGSRYMRLGDV